MEHLNSETKPLVTVIAPVYNEIENIDHFYQRLKKVSDTWNRNHEIIFVDDGSSDGSTEYLQALPEKNSSVRVIRFARNFGQQKAVMAGIDHSKGDIVLFIDVDLQVVPEDIPRLIEKLDEGYDIVAGYRPYREETLLTRKIPSKLVNIFFKKVFHLPYRDLGCGIQAFRKRMMMGVDPFNPMYTHRIIFASWRGGKFADIQVEYNPRTAGKTGYTFTKLLHLFLDMILSFLIHPYELVFLSIAGTAAIGLGFLGTLVQTLFLPATNGLHSGWFIINLFLMFGGLILILFGLINERINRINHQINKTPLYVVDQIWTHSGDSQPSPVEQAPIQ